MSDRNIFLKSMQPDDEDADGLKAAGQDFFPAPSGETLRAPRYGKNSDGTYKRVFIKAFWRGPTEGKVKGKRYRVLTDR